MVWAGRTIVVLLVWILAAPACGDSDPETRAVPSTSATADGTPAPSSTNPATDDSHTAECIAAAITPVVAADINPDGAVLGTVEIRQCQKRYARVIFVPEDTTRFESEQLILKDADGAWVVLTYGTGIDCAAETDWRPAELENACRALGLR